MGCKQHGSGAALEEAGPAGALTPAPLATCCSSLLQAVARREQRARQKETHAKKQAAEEAWREQYNK